MSVFRVPNISDSQYLFKIPRLKYFKFQLNISKFLYLWFLLCCSLFSVWSSSFSVPLLYRFCLKMSYPLVFFFPLLILFFITSFPNSLFWSPILRSCLAPMCPSFSLSIFNRSDFSDSCYEVVVFPLDLLVYYLLFISLEPLLNSFYSSPLCCS